MANLVVAKNRVCIVVHLQHQTTVNSNLFKTLSTQEQESVSGGNFASLGLPSIVYMFYQQTNIDTRGSSAININQGNFNGSALNQTEYHFAQTTFVLAMFFGSDSRRQNSGRRGGNFLTRILGL
ncbi:hypothetical protein [Richelia sinica]|uniref:hypothetical protein n=1 Tax=Richelia sinica TaxID=1357545 RepID=UPI0016822FB4|nr:hypothetical protein [Richelia sinica]MBD2665501.1 hypothetical protein [Richelia sinica FACHB-800]